MACSRGVFTRDTSDLSLVFLAFPRMPVDFLTNDRAGATLRPLRRRAPTPRTSSVFPHWLHEFINMYRRYYFGLTEEVHRGELRALREPARRNSGTLIAPGTRRKHQVFVPLLLGPRFVGLLRWLNPTSRRINGIRATSSGASSSCRTSLMSLGHSGKLNSSIAPFAPPRSFNSL